MDYIVADCAACGAQTKEYAHLLRDDPAVCRARARFSAKVRDVSEFLDALPPRRPLGESCPGASPITSPATWCTRRACARRPRACWRWCPGCELVELNEADWCCGSAGIYNITHVARADQFLERKLATWPPAAPQTLVTGNPGCLLQLHGRRARRGCGWPCGIQWSCWPSPTPGGAGRRGSEGERWNTRLLDELRRALAPERVLTCPEDLVVYSYDGTWLEHRPDVVVLPRAAEEVAPCSRTGAARAPARGAARRRQRPGRRLGAQRGRHRPHHHADEPHRRDRPRGHGGGGRARRGQRRPAGGGRAPGPLLPARPGQPEAVDHRRQRRHRRQRPALPEVRRHQGLRAGPAGGPARRQPLPHWAGA